MYLVKGNCLLWGGLLEIKARILSVVFPPYNSGAGWPSAHCSECHRNPTSGELSASRRNIDSKQELLKPDERMLGSCGAGNGLSPVWMPGEGLVAAGGWLSSCYLPSSCLWWSLLLSTHGLVPRTTCPQQQAAIQLLWERELLCIPAISAELGDCASLLALHHPLHSHPPLLSSYKSSEGGSAVSLQLLLFHLLLNNLCFVLFCFVFQFFSCPFPASSASELFSLSSLSW